jgi:hypothetical protein
MLWTTESMGKDFSSGSEETRAPVKPPPICSLIHRERSSMGHLHSVVLPLHDTPLWEICQGAGVIFVHSDEIFIFLYRASDFFVFFFSVGL